MRCHYDVLGLPLTATIDEIKKAYKKCALQWHPDKHSENKEEANKRFLEVQDAYETLSNDQERAWYDSHREVLINGGVPGETDETKFIFNIYPYFSSSCFRGFDDNDEKSFYAVYGDVFAKIAEEDAPHYEEKEETRAPEFGKSDSDYEEVVGPFYAFWMSYCTPRSFVWIEKHDTRDANDRYVRRLMEKENKKLRDKAKKERNEEIRKLVAFIRKKDPRVEQYKKVLEEKALLNQKKAQEKREAERQRRAEQIKNYVQPEWSNIGSQLDELELDDENRSANRSKTNKSPEGADGDGEEAAESNENEEDDESDFDESLYCVACDKSFKSVKSFSNHEKSKKHKENIEILKRHMKEEDASLFISDLGKKDADANGEEEEEDDDEENNQSTRSRLSKKQKKKRKQNRAVNLNLSDEDEEEEGAAVAADEVKAANSTEPVIDNERDDDDDDESGTPPTENKDDANNDNAEAMTSSASAPIQDESDPKSSTTKSKKKATKKEQAKTSSAPPSAPSSTKPVILLKCTVCHKEFESRNKLYQHITSEGHTANKIEVTAATAAVALDAGLDLDGQPLSHNAIKKNKRLAKLANKK